MLEATAHAAIAASNLDRARKFYEETLGLKTKEERSDGIPYETGGTWFLVYQSSFAGTNQATAMAFEVGDLDATVEDLQGRGVTFEQYDLPGLKTDERGIVEMGDLCRVGRPPSGLCDDRTVRDRNVIDPERPRAGHGDVERDDLSGARGYMARLVSRSWV